MGTHKIKTLGAECLRQKSKPALPWEENEACFILDEMSRVMRECKGVGLAAPQIGINKRIIILDCGNSILEMINPEISTAEGSIQITEACLSIPGAEVKPKRAGEIRVKGLDRNFKPVRFYLKGLPAVIAQHEIDHLDGILITDYLTAVDKKVLQKPWKKN